MGFEELSVKMSFSIPRNMQWTDVLPKTILNYLIIVTNLYCNLLSCHLVQYRLKEETQFFHHDGWYMVKIRMHCEKGCNWPINLSFNIFLNSLDYRDHIVRKKNKKSLNNNHVAITISYSNILKNLTHHSFKKI